MGSCLDLRKLQDNADIESAFGRLVSGKSGYKTVIEKKKEPLRCPSCRIPLSGEEKFCPECGSKIISKEKK